MKEVPRVDELNLDISRWLPKVLISWLHALKIPHEGPIIDQNVLLKKTRAYQLTTTWINGKFNIRACRNEGSLKV